MGKQSFRKGIHRVDEQARVSARDLVIFGEYMGGSSITQIAKIHGMSRTNTITRLIYQAETVAKKMLLIGPGYWRSYLSPAGGLMEASYLKHLVEIISDVKVIRTGGAA